MSETESKVPDDHCAYFLKKKRRFCRFRPSVGQSYCAEHLGLLGIDCGRKRINCPLNPKHTCFEDQLEKHLKKCPNQKKSLPPYFTQGINTGIEDPQNSKETKIPWGEIPLKELRSIIDRVQRLYDEHVKSIQEEILYHECLDEELSNEAYGIQAIRHRKQQASLVGHLQNMGLLHEGLCYVELGAGKGMLSHWIQKAMPNTSDVAFVLVDRSSVRYKADNLHKWKENGPKFERIRIDIGDLNLGKVESIQDGGKPVVAVGKHLCGGATDLALRCVTNTLQTTDENSASQPECKKAKMEEKESQRSHLSGVAIALCCHHRCDWQTYVGKTFMSSCGVSSRDFQIMCKLSGWATATWEGYKTKEQMENQNNASIVNNTKSAETGDMSNIDRIVKAEVTNVESETTSKCDDTSDVKAEVSNVKSETTSTCDNTSNVKAEVSNISEAQTESGEEKSHERPAPLTRTDLNLTRGEREEIGRKCKRLIDYGRVKFLSDLGIKSDLKVYIDEKLTPENVVILAKLS